MNNFFRSAMREVFTRSTVVAGIAAGAATGLAAAVHGDVKAMALLASGFVAGDFFRRASTRAQRASRSILNGQGPSRSFARREAGMIRKGPGL